MQSKYQKVAPQADYECACGSEHHYRADELFYYVDESSVGYGEGFYCMDCIDDAENERLREEIDPLRDEMIDNLIAEDMDEAEAEEAAVEAYPFNHAEADVSLAAAMADKA